MKTMSRHGLQMRQTFIARIIEASMAAKLTRRHHQSAAEPDEMAQMALGAMLFITLAWHADLSWNETCG